MTERQSPTPKVEIRSLRLRVDRATVDRGRPLTDAALADRIAGQLPVESRTPAVVADLVALVRRALR